VARAPEPADLPTRPVPRPRGTGAARRRSRTRRGAVATLTLLLAAACSSGTTSTSAPSTAAGSGPGSTLATAAGAAGAGATTPGTPGTPGTAATAVTYPGAEWDTIDATAAGFDPAKLAAIASRAEAGASRCLLVTRHGKIVDEHYWAKTNTDSAQEVFSATKSYTSTLVGIAQAEGKLKVTDKASQYIPEWAGTPSGDVTIENLLKNDSGRHWDAKTDYTDMTIQAKDKTAFSIALGQDAAPGTVWAYNNSAIQTLSAVLKKATGMDASAYAKQKLLDPIGMTHSELKKDASGGSLTFMGLSSTCRDMARFGYLMLHDGAWAGKQVVPASWVDAATGHSSQPLNAAYGYLWWLNRRGPIASPLQPTTGETGGDQKDGQLVPGAPEDMFFALGFGNQIISVDPGSDTVVVRLGPGRAPAGSGTFTQKDTAAVVTDALVR
jgi:CubicO group peptidase (beta-lactamase class C family)